MTLLVTDMTDFVEQMREAEQAIVPPDLREKGWQYIDPPGRFTHEMWNLFLSILGEGEHQVLVTSEGTGWKRGQLIVSPKAMENIRDWRPTP